MKPIRDNPLHKNKTQRKGTSYNERHPSQKAPKKYRILKAFRNYFII